MIDPLLSLAFSIHSNRGVYTLLLGSGVSRAARIPTGWEVVLDLIRKLAHIQGADCGEDPAGWYRAKYSEDPDYSKLLDHLGKSPSDRSQILRKYFEPTDEQRAQGLKRPTEAHKAIARLMVGGYIRVVVTTNFDRLLEQALEELGVQPSVISTPEAVDGARPLIHAGPSIVKIHGDYLDERIKNTLAELESYDLRFDGLLDRIWAEFGVVTCGWSADWDVALLKSFERCPNHRFPMYWTSLGKPSAKAEKLITHRKATIITIEGADPFFTDLAAKISALEAFDRPHPLSAKIAVETLKSYLVDDRHRIRLEELVRDECERVLATMASASFAASGPVVAEDEYRKRARQAEAATETLLAMMIAGCYWGGDQHIFLWTNCLERLGCQKAEGGYTAWTQLRRLPAVLLYYGGGIAALASGRTKTFVALSKRTRLKIKDETTAASFGLPNWSLGDGGHFLPSRKPDGGGKFKYPVTEYLFDFLREPLRSVVPDDDGYGMLFDRFEYLTAFAHVLKVDPKEMPTTPFPGGRFVYRSEWSEGGTVQRLIEEELAEQAEAWGPFRDGFFGDEDWQQFRERKKAFDAEIRQRANRFF